MCCQRENPRCPMSDYRSATEAGWTLTQRWAARAFSGAKCPRGELLSVTHTQLPSCELVLFHLRIPAITFVTGGELLIGFCKNKADGAFVHIAEPDPSLVSCVLLALILDAQ